MAILQECPICHRKQSLKNKLCNKCKNDLDKAKRSKKVKYWINYRLPDGRQARELVGAFEGLKSYSITDARDAYSKKKVLKKEKKLFNILERSKLKFQEITDWYIENSNVKKLSSYARLKIGLNRFNEVFGNSLISDLKYTDLQGYQNKRTEQGIKPVTIDYEISVTKTMLTTAYYDEMIDGSVLLSFNRLKRKLIKGSNARKRTLSFDEYTRLINAAPAHLKAVLEIAFHTGMRRGEIRQLKRSYIDNKAGFIRLPKEITKEKKNKDILIKHHVKRVLDSILRVLRQKFVITYKNSPIKQAGGLHRSFKTACKNAKIPCGRKTEKGITFHDIRRTVKTNMLKAGVEKEYRDTILGHSLKGMDKHYIVIDDKSLTDAMDKYTSWIDEKFKSSFANVDHSVDQMHKNG
jgi:integrase